jgi:hypothetical protein
LWSLVEVEVVVEVIAAQMEVAEVPVDLEPEPEWL